MTYGPYSPLVLALAGIVAALIVWAFPGADDRIGFALAIAGVALALAGIVWSLWRASS
jgi:predicted acyltransferase